MNTIRHRIVRRALPVLISGIYENTSVNEDGTWKLSGMDLDYIWSAPSRGGWVRIKTPSTAPFPTSGRTEQYATAGALDWFVRLARSGTQALRVSDWPQVLVRRS